MFGFLLSKKLRSLVIEIYLKNWEVLGRYNKVGEWNENWKVMSLNETLQNIKKIAEDSKNLKLQWKISIIPTQLGSMVDDLDNPSINDAYTCAYKIYYNKKPSANEQNKLISEFKAEKEKRGLTIE
jgi:hypothetical protein